MTSAPTWKTQTRLGRLSLPGTLGVGAALTLVVFWGTARREHQMRERDFEKRASDATVALINAFSVPAEVALALPAFISTHPALDAATFNRFTLPTAARHPAIAALEWMPLVNASERASFESENQMPIVEPDARGNMVRALPRERYFPIRFMTPEVPGVLGLDVAFEPFRQRMLQRAMHSDGAFLSERFRLVEDAEGTYSIALYAPVRETPAPGEHGEFAGIRGLSVALFRLAPVVENALEDLSLQGMRFVLEDESADAAARVLYAGGSADVPEATRLRSVRSWQYLNRQWRLTWYGDPAHLSGPSTSLFVLVAGVLLTLASATIVLTLRRMQRLARRFDATRPLGNYTLLQKLGEGGMGTVYLARHALLRRPTAVKIIRAGLGDDTSDAEAKARFEREVQWTAQLTHPNTIAVFDYGRSEDGQFYYAMEYIHGLSLEYLVKHSGRLPEARAVHLLLQVCGALGEAHELGLVHRDVKPDNVMVCVRGGVPDFVKVLDFGLAKGLEARDAKVSRTGGTVGTPGYIAPETLLTGEATTRSDVYSLGALLYYLLTATPVHTGVTPMAVISQTLSGPPEPSEEAAATVSPKLIELTMLCMGDAARRPADATELGRALAALELPRWTPQQGGAWWQSVGADLLGRRDAETVGAGSGSTLFVDLTTSGRFR